MIKFANQSSAWVHRVAAAVLISMMSVALVACGGGSGGGASGGATAGTTTFSATPFKGKFTSGTVTVTDANGNSVTLLNSSGTIAANGTVSISVPDNTAYPLTISVTGTYFDEITGTSATTSNALRTMVPDANAAAAGIPVTAITEIATALVVQQVSGGATLTGALVKSNIGNVAAALLGQTYAQAMTAPVFDSNGKTSDPNTLQLAALAVAANTAGTGADLAAKIKDIGVQIAAGTAITAVISQALYNNSVSAVNGGANSLLPSGSSAPSMPTVAVASFSLVDGAVAADTMVWDTASAPLYWDSGKWR